MKMPAASMGANTSLSALVVESGTNGVRRLELQGYRNDSGQALSTVTEAAVRAAVQSTPARLRCFMLLVALHGILTGQSGPSWPDHLDAWFYRENGEAGVHVLKKEYLGGPFPRWNLW